MVGEQERWECPNCGTPLNIAALGIYAKVACPACGHIDHVHTMLANFRIEGVLGLGGMSVVLRARDLVLERPLAIKLLNEFYRDQPERIARFEQECELMAKVRHENVVSLYSAGRVKGQFYIAMELVNGRNLEELVREEGPMEPLRALNILRQVVKGLAAAYKAGLLHRDMKPANILICEDDHAKVLDFGLSHGRRDANTEEIIWATPYYVPPETLMREPEDTRTDIYALGMTLRHLLTGQENFDPVPEDIDGMLDCKRNLPPVAEVMPGLPEPYCDLIDHMTAYEPAGRPESYSALMVEIDEVRAALAAEGQGMPLAERARRAMPLMAGAAATLLLGAGVAALSASFATPEPERLYAIPAAALPWQERDALAAAMQQLQAGSPREAAALFAALADSDGEPAACAWAALHAKVLGILLGESLGDQLPRHLERTPASAGQALFERMAALQEKDARLSDKFLLAAHGLLQAEQLRDACRERELQMHLAGVERSLAEAGEGYASMRKLLEAYEARLRSSLPERAAQLCRRSLAHLDMPEAARAMALMESAAGDEATRARLAVQKEALALFCEAVEMMKRRSLLPAAGTAVEPAQLPELLRPLGDDALAAELAALMLVARGELEAAAALSPHALVPDAPEPFAVIMRDWLSRAR